MPVTNVTTVSEVKIITRNTLKIRVFAQKQNELARVHIFL